MSTAPHERLPQVGDVWRIGEEVGIIDAIEGFRIFVCLATQAADGTWRAASVKEVGGAALWQFYISRARFIELSRNGEFLGCWPNEHRPDHTTALDHDPSNAAARPVRT